MAEHKSGQSDHTHCGSCAKIKEEQCAETKRALEECAKTQEEARVAKESLLAEQLEEAKTKIKSMQKTLMAFQLATTVGVTILGQEMFDKITSKVDEVKQVQDKIAGNGSAEHKDEPSSTKKPPIKTSLIGNSTLGLFPYNKNTDHVNSYFSNNMMITQKSNEEITELWVSEEAKSNRWSYSGQHLGQVTINSQVPASSNSFFDLYNNIIQAAPQQVAVSFTSDDNNFFNDGGAYSQSEISSIPEPQPFSLITLGLINHTKRRSS